MKLLTLLYVFCLFYVFIPGNVFKLPIKTSKMNIILIHALLFSVVLSCTYGLVENVRVLEGYRRRARLQESMRVRTQEGMSGAHTHDEKDIKKTESKDPKEPVVEKEIPKDPKEPVEKPKDPKEPNFEKEMMPRF